MVVHQVKVPGTVAERLDWSHCNAALSPKPSYMMSSCASILSEVAGVRQLETPNPEHAWRTLSLMNEWIRHADAKAGVTLALAGVLGTMLFTLSEQVEDWTRFSASVVIFTCLCLGATIVLCGLTLIPRTRSSVRNPAPNLLFFGSIASHYKDNRQKFRTEFNTLSSNPETLTSEIADQIHANAHIATTKSRRTTWAIVAILLASVGVGFLALIIGTTTP